MTYQYLGEDSGDILSVAFAFEDAQRAVGLTAKGWSKSAKVLGEPGTWTGAAADAAKSDASKIGGILAETDKTLTASGKALVTYANALAGLWGQVYDLNTELVKQQNIITAANNTLQGLHSAEDRGTGKQQQKAFAEADQAHTDISRAQKNIGDLDDQYDGLKRKQSEAAHTCITALTTPAGKKGVTFGGPQSLTQLNSILGLNKLDVAPLIHAEKISADLLKRHQPVDATDPKVQAEITQLDGILKAHSGDPNFSSAYLRHLGPHNLLDLTGVVATMNQGSDGKTQPIMTTVGDLQHELGVSLASATHYLGKTAPTGTDQLGATWLAELKKQGESKFTFAVGGFDAGAPVGIVPPTNESVYGYSMLGVLMGDAHTPFAQPLLQQVGDDMMHMEQQYGKTHFTQSLNPQSSDGSLMWLSSGGGVGDTGLQLNWDNPKGQPFSTGADPFSGWTRAMSDSPAAARATMAHDNNLTNYLLNDRSWALNDGHVHSGQMGITDRIVDHPEDNGTLKGFGGMLAHVDDPSDPNSTKMMENVVNDLGGTNNPNVAHGFAGSDWIRPGLRDGVATLMSHHLSEVNLTMGHSLHELPQANVEKVLGDLGKDEGSYGILYKGEAAYAGVTITNALQHGGDASTLATEYGNVNAFLDHGADTGWAHEQNEKAEEHNKWVEYAGDIFKTAAGTATEVALPEAAAGAGPAIDTVVDKVTDSVLGGFKEDPSDRIQSHNQYTQAHTAQALSDNVTQAVYASMTPAQQHAIFGTHPPAPGHLSGDDFDRLSENIDPGAHPTAANNAYSGAQTAASQAYQDVDFRALGE